LGTVEAVAFSAMLAAVLTVAMASVMATTVFPRGTPSEEEDDSTAVFVAGAAVDSAGDDDLAFALEVASVALPRWRMTTGRRLDENRLDAITPLFRKIPDRERVVTTVVRRRLIVDDNAINN